MSKTQKMYVIVRNDLTTGQKAVQAGHALAEWMLEDSESWKNTTLVYLAVKDKDHLEMLVCDLQWSDVKYVQFNEPDINNEITAIASYGMNKAFKKLRLLI